MRGLLTLADLDDRDSRGNSVAVRHDAVLSDGSRVLLLDDRGWSSSRWPESETVEDVKRTARMVSERLRGRLRE